jgi:hypothetical protein
MPGIMTEMNGTLKKIEQFIRRFVPKRLENYKLYINALRNKSGLEIGGPSPAFTTKGFLPVYAYINALDGCNFSTSTIWEGDINEGNNYIFGKRKGHQYIAEGTDLSMIPSEKYDFVLSCHSIEHLANPIRALLEWKRVIRDNGYILLVVPHKDQTFDHNRPLTTLEHLVTDFENNTPESDTTHFEEIIQFHDLSLDNGLPDQASLRKRTYDNINNRCVHHHVFNTTLVARLANHLSLKICDIRHFNPFNIVILVQKSNTAIPDNSTFLNPLHIAYKKGKFPSDKIW